MEGDDAARGDRNFFAGLGIAAGTLRLVAQLEIAEAGQLDAIAPFQRIANFLEKALDHVLGFALVQPDLFEQQIGKFGLCKRHSVPRNPGHLRSSAANAGLRGRDEFSHRRLDLAI